MRIRSGSQRASQAYDEPKLLQTYASLPQISRVQGVDSLRTCTRRFAKPFAARSEGAVRLRLGRCRSAFGAREN